MGALRREIRLAFSQGGRTIETGRAFRLLKCEGLSATEYETSALAAAGRHGDAVTGRRALARYVSAVMDAPAEDREPAVRHFHPFEDGELVATVNGISRRISYAVDRFAVLEGNVWHPRAAFAVRLRCADPFFRHMTDFGRDVAETVPLEAFPHILPLGRPSFPSYRLRGASVALDNPGDMEIGLRLEVLARAPAKGFRFDVGGARMDVHAEIPAGSVLEVSTEPGRKSVSLDGENIIHMAGRDSRFPMLARGPGLFRFGAGDGVRNLAVRVFFTPLYLGV